VENSPFRFTVHDSFGFTVDDFTAIDDETSPVDDAAVCFIASPADVTPAPFVQCLRRGEGGATEFSPFTGTSWVEGFFLRLCADVTGGKKTR